MLFIIVCFLWEIQKAQPTHLSRNCEQISVPGLCVKAPAGSMQPASSKVQGGRSTSQLLHEVFCCLALTKIAWCFLQDNSLLVHNF